MPRTERTAAPQEHCVMKSLIGSASVIVASLLKKRCFTDPVRAVFLLSLADFLAAAILISTGIIQLLPAALFILVYEICPYGLLLAMMFYSISFLMAIVYAFETHLMVKGWRCSRASDLQDGNRKRTKLYLSYGLAWLVPLLLFLVQLISRGWTMKDVAPLHIDTKWPWSTNQSEGNYGLFCSRCIILIHKSQDFCYKFMDNKNVNLDEKIAFFVYLLLVFICCTFLYCRVKLWCRQHEASPQLKLENDGFDRRNIRSVSKSVHLIQLVFLVCWTPAFLLSVLSFTSVTPSSVYGLFVIQALTISLQGFLDSLVYGWLRQNFRQEAIGERMPLCLNQSTAFYDDSFSLT
ncbi:transmembrane protein 116 isoform X2 [Microcaecilia unicolor]|uniref:Transmembrane protein 116-like isoform X2 n=1 Tax=Microcaecilia unicolor TaxID=1415580 RepID=A0A6P7ZA31_9AMPH|nr:transmembrane protein 116-like isoform X2 [Microcaecilia unicolor]